MGSGSSNAIANTVYETCNVLVVDDQADILELLGWLPRSEGFRISTATNGRDALDLLAGTKFDVGPGHLDA